MEHQNDKSPAGQKTMHARALANDAVHVFVLTSDPRSSRALLVADIFDHELFNVHLTSVQKPRGADLNLEELQNYRLQFIFKEAAKRQIDHFVIVKDTSVSATNPAIVADVVRAAITEDYDITYLGKHRELCDQFDPGSALADSTITLHRAIDPRGTQAILFNARARDFLLENGAFSKGLARALQDNRKNLKMGVTSPNIVSYNPASARGLRDYEKLQECRFPGETPMELTPASPLTPPEAPANTNVVDDEEPLSFDEPIEQSIEPQKKTSMRRGWLFLVLLIVLFVLLVLLAVYFLAPRVRASRADYTESDEGREGEDTV